MPWWVIVLIVFGSIALAVAIYLLCLIVSADKYNRERKTADKFYSQLIPALRHICHDFDRYLIESPVKELFSLDLYELKDLVFDLRDITKSSKDLEKIRCGFGEDIDNSLKLVDEAMISSYQCVTENLKKYLIEFQRAHSLC